MSIREKVEALKDEIERECGIKANIRIAVHDNRNYINFKKANHIANCFQSELGGRKNIWSNPERNVAGISAYGYHKLADWVVFFDREKELARVK